MNLICTASADTYITNKIINSQFRAIDANVGHAATLDLFKLYNETKLLNSASQTELSRILLKFDYSPITALTSTILDLNSDSFRAYISLTDIMTGHAVPRNFTASIFPLSSSFDEGMGQDTISFDDIHTCNFITSSYTTQNNVWFVSGANAGGLLGSSNIDYISSGNLNDGVGIRSLEFKQTFENGDEDLFIDVTSIVSATVANQIQNNGFRLSFTGSQEVDEKTRFVKRFAARHVSNRQIRPKIIVKFDDSIEDNHNNFTFNTTGSLYLNSFSRSSYSNIVSGSQLTQITGSNCILFELNKGTFSFFVTASQRTAGTSAQPVTGQYVATFAIPDNITTLYNRKDTIQKLINDDRKIEFTTYWKSLDGSVAFNTGTLVIQKNDPISGDFSTRNEQIIATNLSQEYSKNDTVRIRLFGRNLNSENNEPVKRSIKLKSTIYEKLYYQVIDSITKKIIIPYDSVTNSTKVSTDIGGMFFDFNMNSLTIGRSYSFEFFIIDRGTSFLIKDASSVFTVKD